MVTFSRKKAKNSNITSGVGEILVQRVAANRVSAVLLHCVLTVVLVSSVAEFENSSI